MEEIRRHLSKTEFNLKMSVTGCNCIELGQIETAMCLVEGFNTAGRYCLWSYRLELECLHSLRTTRWCLIRNWCLLIDRNMYVQRNKQAILWQPLHEAWIIWRRILDLARSGLDILVRVTTRPGFGYPHRRAIIVIKLLMIKLLID